MWTVQRLTEQLVYYQLVALKLVILMKFRTVYYRHYNKKRHNFLLVLRDMGAPFQDVTQKVNELSFIGFLLGVVRRPTIAQWYFTVCTFCPWNRLKTIEQIQKWQSNRKLGENVSLEMIWKSKILCLWPDDKYKHQRREFDIYIHEYYITVSVFPGDNSMQLLATFCNSMQLQETRGNFLQLEAAFGNFWQLWCCQKRRRLLKTPMWDFTVKRDTPSTESWAFSGELSWAGTNDSIIIALFKFNWI